MTEDKTENAAPGPQNHSKWIIIALALMAITGLALAYPMLSKKSDAQQAEANIAPENTLETTAIEIPPLSDMKRERILGDRSAPIKISEHSSLTCGHCGNFHKNTFAQFKAEYIDTGRAYLVFSDFPLNAPALHATMLSRCIAEDRYFEFIDELFAKQEEWAYDVGYLNTLRTIAKPYGLNSATVDACIENTELQDAILKRLQANQQQYGISSTPSFVINNKTVINGAINFEAFDKAIQDAIKANEQNE